MNIEHLKELDKNHYIHPFTNHNDMYEQNGTHIIQSAKGVYVVDENGRKILDGLAGLWCVNVGYGRQEIVDAVRQQMERVAYYPSFFNSTTESAILLAEKIKKYAPKTMSRVFFSNSGSEANESTLKMIRAYHTLKKQPKKTKILTLNYGYHGVTLATTSMTQLPSCQTPFQLPLPGFIQVPGPYRYGYNTDKSEAEFLNWCLSETERIIKQEDADTIAAIFVEPVQGAGGVIVPTPTYLTGLRNLAREHKILFVADEVITGFGRLGCWFASEKWDLDPDFISLAKGLTSGYLPLGASLIREDIAEILVKGGYFAHGYTYSGHPSCCAAGLANLDILEKEQLIPYTENISGPYFQKKLHELKSHPAVSEVRGHGLIGALELVPKEGKKGLNPNAFLGPKAMKIAREEGIIIRGIRDLVALAPPLVIQKDEIDILFSGVQRMLNRLWE